MTEHRLMLKTGLQLRTLQVMVYLQFFINFGNFKAPNPKIR